MQPDTKKHPERVDTIPRSRALGTRLESRSQNSKGGNPETTFDTPLWIPAFAGMTPGFCNPEP